MYQLYCRIYQCVFKGISYLLPWRMPELIQGENSLNKLPKLIKSKGIDSVLIVTDKMIASLGLMDELLKGLSNEGVDFMVYDRTVPNPTIDNIEEALQMYNANNCKGIVAFGGGSSIDCAKGVGARAARPKKSIPQMKGLFKVLKKTPPLFAIPTTSGTGSETTIAAVITDSRTHEKYAINDTALIPQYAVLDPVLTVNLPPHITSTTGIDALTHAVEAYIGRSNTKATKQYSRNAVKLIFENIYEAYSNGQNLAARKNMQEASFFAGLAFTRAYVGYVHAIAHTLGGFYSVPHGLANAIILPYVLEYYGKSAHKPLAELADMVGLSEPGDNSEQKSLKFIHAIKMLNKSMGIPNKVNGIIESDVPLMVKRALAESNPLYPVPKIMNEEDIMRIYLIIKE
ncbi:iron-containing alcohol dehydrogenase [Desulfosporosinus sp.]|uniref:iron-containing alcohol dehydrogenase n=1 Tax=Desulfosporosinus sp. TaxID=157907 RepID=UPI00230FF488|nr:iron-containing alcohol dehydrogenase [Desulfosporosinus sp.]MDA8221989.1 iron-containing alcohol dehydrogenase [Desulfitobacterium hafniense]